MRSRTGHRWALVAVSTLLAVGMVAPATAADVRRVALDHVGAYNFVVEISGVDADDLADVRFVATGGLPESVQPAGEGDYVIRRTPRKRGAVVELVGLLEGDGRETLRKRLAALEGRRELAVEVELYNRKPTSLHGAGTVCGWRMVKTDLSTVRFEQDRERDVEFVVMELRPRRVQSACERLAS